MQPRDLPSTSAHFSCGCRSFCEIPSTFRLYVGHTVIIPCVRGTFHPIPSTSVKIMCLWDLLKMFREANGPSVNFHQPSVHSRDNLLTFFASAGPSVNVCQLYCGRRNFRKLSVHPWDLPSTYPTSAGLSINLCQLCVHLRDHLSTFRASAGPFVNFPCVSRTFFKLSAHLQDLPSTSVNFLCICGTFSQLAVHPWNLPSTFCGYTEISSTSRQLSVFPRVTLRQHSMQQWYLPSTSVNLPCICGTFHKISLRLWDIP